MKLQKRIAARILKCGTNRIKIDSTKLGEAKEAITAFDIMRLAKKKIISKKQAIGVSRSRAKQRTIQKRKGRQRGHGSRKGKAGARQNPKQKWINNSRAQRTLLKKLRENQHIVPNTYRELYLKVKGGYFRSTNHIKIYLQEHQLIVGGKK
ncbi:50S ribosomal protein L19e [Candidatus Woesearchaeota archaeon CG10_big_fil_rev_8_21_14_0_10_37_12]|nr:MAG: 50S ribosomal protein L19e [Candidatus Woesearchaeota archaeon CG10_big_fil_rev_8_21_14_0_10_37_12]